MLEASCTHPPVSGLCFQEILVRKLCCAECQDCGEGGSWFLLAWKVQQGLKKKKRKVQRNVPAIIYKLVHFGFGSTWQLWAICRAKADT